MEKLYQDLLELLLRINKAIRKRRTIPLGVYEKVEDIEMSLTHWKMITGENIPSKVQDVLNKIRSSL
jgi:hypothetical protein